MMPTADYFRFIATTFSHAVLDTVRRRRNQTIGAIITLPALIPLLLLALGTGQDFDEANTSVFANMIEMLYIRAVTPLLALFFGAMLIGEDIESQTIPYVLSRPIPRSAWVSGLFLAYWTICSLLLALALTLTYVSCIVLDVSFLSSDTVLLLLRYEGAAVMSLLGYGAVCMLLGAVVRRPIVVGILLIFLWQRAAMFAPGLTDFLTIEKYVNALLPGGGSSVVSLMEASAFEIIKSETPISAASATIALIAVAATCVAGTTRAVLNREYTTPTAVTE